MKIKWLAFVIMLGVIPAAFGAQCCRLCNNGSCHTTDFTGLENGQTLCINLDNYYLESAEYYNAESCQEEVPEYGVFGAVLAVLGAVAYIYYVRK